MLLKIIIISFILVPSIEELTDDGTDFRMQIGMGEKSGENDDGIDNDTEEDGDGNAQIVSSFAFCIF